MNTDEDFAYEDFLKELEIEENRLINVKQAQIDRVHNYLGTYGDSIQSKIMHLQHQAIIYFEERMFTASFIYSIVAIELIIKFFIIRPIFESVVISDSIAEELTKNLFRNNKKQRKYLSLFLKTWNIDIDFYKLRDKKYLEDSINSVFNVRNIFLHKGIEPNEKESKMTMQCLEVLSKLVYDLASAFGFTLNETAKWSEISNGCDSFNTGVLYNKSFKQKNYL